MLLFQTFRILLAAVDLDSATAQARTDSDDLRAAIAGNQTAFERLVRRYHGQLKRFLKLYVPDASSADDAAQETWIAVLKDGESFQNRSAFRTWLFKVGARRAQDLSRRLGRDEERVRQWLTDAESAHHEIPRGRFLPSDHPNYPEHWGHPPTPVRQGPDHLLFQREAAGRVQEELKRLPEAMAAVVTLRDFAGLSGAETATAVGLTQSHQRVLLHRARLRLWAAWEEYEGKP